MKLKIPSFIKKYKYLIAILILFILLRIPSLLEPYWVGDEGIYAAVAHGMRNGQVLYVDTWDHKTPGIYLIYYFFSFFNENQLFFLRLFNLTLGLLTVFITFKISKKYIQIEYNEPETNSNTLKKIIPYIASLLVTVFLGTPWLEGNIFNAENIFILSNAVAFLFFFKINITKSSENIKYILIGLMFGVGVFIKIHPIFDLAAVLVCILFLVKDSLQSKFKNILVILFFASLPLILTTIYYFLIGDINSLIESTLIYNFGYSDYVFEDSNSITLSFPVKILLLGLATTVTLALKRILKRGNTIWMLMLWLIFAIAAVYLPKRYYSHYSLQLIIPASILISIVIIKLLEFLKKKINLSLKVLSFLSILITLLMLSQFGQLEKSLLGSENIFSSTVYYEKGYGYMTGHIAQKDWFDHFYNTAEETKLLQAVNKYQDEYVFMWAKKPWLYPLANIKNPVKYVVEFHIEDHLVPEVITELEIDRVEIVIIDTHEDPPQELINYLQEEFMIIDSVLDGQFQIYQRKFANIATNT